MNTNPQQPTVLPDLSVFVAQMMESATSMNNAYKVLYNEAVGRDKDIEKLNNDIEKLNAKIVELEKKLGAK